MSSLEWLPQTVSWPSTAGNFSGMPEGALLQRLYAAQTALSAYRTSGLAKDLDDACALIGHSPILQIPEQPHNGAITALRDLSMLTSHLEKDLLDERRCQTVLVWLQCLHEKCRFHLSHSPEIGGHTWRMIEEKVTEITAKLAVAGNDLYAVHFSVLAQRMAITYGPATALSRTDPRPINDELESIQGALATLRGYSADGRMDDAQLKSATTAARTNTLLILLKWLGNEENKAQSEYAGAMDRAWELATHISWVPNLPAHGWKTLVENTNIEQCEIAELDLVENVLRHFPPGGITTLRREAIAQMAIQRLGTTAVSSPLASLLMRLSIVALQGAITNPDRRKKSDHTASLTTVERLLAGRWESRPTGIAYIRLLALRALMTASTLSRHAPIPDGILDDMFHLLQAAGGVTRDDDERTLQQQARSFMATWENVPYASQREDLAQTVVIIAKHIIGASGMMLVLRHSQARITQMMEQIAGNISASRQDIDQLTTEWLDQDFQEVEKVINSSLGEISQAYFDGYCSLSLISLPRTEGNQNQMRQWYTSKDDEMARYCLPVGGRHPVTGEELCILARADISALQYLIPIFRSLKSQRVFDILSSQLSELVAYRRERFDEHTGALKEEKAEKLADKRGFNGHTASFWITNLSDILASRSTEDRWRVKKELLQALHRRVISQLQSLGIDRSSFIVGVGSMLTIYPNADSVAEKISLHAGNIRQTIHELVEMQDGSKYRPEPEVTTSLGTHATKVRDIRVMHDRVQEALRENHIRIFLQPIRLIDNHTHAEKFEALLRVVDRNGNLMRINIEEFVQVAAMIGRMEDISRFVVISCFELLRKYTSLQLSCNLRLDDFQDGPISLLFERNRNLCPRLIVEISEREAGDDVDEKALALRERFGFVLALDDYGKDKSNFGRKSGTIIKFDKDYIRKNIFPKDGSGDDAKRYRREAIWQILLALKQARAPSHTGIDRRIVIEWLETIEEVNTLRELITEESNPAGRSSNVRRFELDLSRYLYYQGFAEEWKPGPADEMLAKFHLPKSREDRRSA